MVLLKEHVVIQGLPLYLKNLSAMPLQVSDEATARHFFTSESPQRVDIQNIFPEFIPIPTAHFLAFTPEKSWYPNPLHALGIHGIPHVDRVGPLFDILAQMENTKTPGALSDREILIGKSAITIHDLLRVDDRWDPGHGARAAEWFDNLQNQERLLKKIRSVFPDFGNFSPQEIDEVKALCTYHESPVKDIPQEVWGKYGKTLELVRFADALDRYRTASPEWWPKEEYFPEGSSARVLLESGFSKYFCLKNEVDRLSNPKHPSVEEAIIQTGLEVGIFTLSSNETLHEEPLQQQYPYQSRRLSERE